MCRQVLVVQLAAKQSGYADVVYLDAKTDTYLEEVSSCNIFVVKGNVIKTPPLAVSPRTFWVTGCQPCAVPCVIISRGQLSTICKIAQLSSIPHLHQECMQRRASCEGIRGSTSISIVGMAKSGPAC